MISISFDGNKLTYEQTMRLHSLINQIHEITPLQACIDAPPDIASLIQMTGSKITEKDVYGQTHEK